MAIQWVDVGNVVARFVAAIVTTFTVGLANIFMTAITGNRVRQQPPAQAAYTRHGGCQRIVQPKPGM